LADAEAFIDTDPYYRSGLFQERTVYRWLRKNSNKLCVDQRSYPHVILATFKKSQLKNVRANKLPLQHKLYYESLEKVYLAGPLVDVKKNRQSLGFILELNAESIEEAQQIVDNDPYSKLGMYDSVKVLSLLELDVSGRYVHNQNRKSHLQEDDPVRRDMREWGLLETEHDFFFPLYDLMNELDRERLEQEEYMVKRQWELIGRNEAENE